MSGDSTFGNSNVAAESSISVSDVNETLDKPETSNDGTLQFNNTELPDQSVDAEWERRSAAAMANLLKKLGDSTTQPKSPEKRLSRWRQKLSSRGMDEAQSSKKTEEQFNLTDDSIDVAEQKLKSRRTFFQRNAPKKKSTEISENAFDVTESSVEERPTRVTRGFAKKYTAKTNVDPKDFDTTDGSIVVDKLKESRKKRFKHQKRKVTQADINEFNVSDEDESQREKTGDDLVLELDEAEKESEREGAGNSMDESEESEHEAENNENQSLEIQSPVEQAEAEDSLDEEVDENETESSKSNRNVSKNGDEVDKQKNNGVAEAGSSNEPSSLLLEFQLSTDNHSECKIVVTESHNRSHISHKEGSTNNISMTDITMTSRRSRRFTQHGSQFLDVVENREKSRDIDLQNFGKSLCDVGDILNVSPNLGKKSLGPVEGEINLILSPAKEISESDSSNRSLQRRKRSSASKELFSNSRTSSSGKATSENDSKQNLDDSIGVHGGSVQPLNLEDREIDRSLKDSSNGGITEVNILKNKNMGRNGSKENMNLSREDVFNDSVASNRSLRSRTRGESNKSIIDDVDSTKSGKSGNAINESLKETDEVRDINRSLRKRTGNKNSSMSEKEGSEENSKGANDSQNEEKGNRSSRNGSERGGKNKSVTEEEIGDMSMDIINASQQGEDELENSKRSLKNNRGRRDKSSSEEDSSKENEKRGNLSIDALNVSKQGLDESDSSHRSLRDTSASKRLLNQSATENQASKKGRRESSKKVVTEKEISKENYDNVIIDAQDEERAGNRSLRSRSVTKGKLNKSISEDQISKQNVDDTMNSVHDSLGFVSNARTTRRASMAASKEHTSESSSDENAENIHVSLRSSVGRDKRSRSKNSSGLVDQVSSDFGIAGIGEDSPMTDINAMNGVTYSSEEIVGQKQGARSKNSSVLYNSLDSFGEEQSNSVSMLQIPRSVNESAAAINNSLDSTVNASRRDQPIPPNQSADEMMPAPRSLPFRKRRLANSNTPSFSSLAQKKKRNAPAETDSIVGLVEKQNDLVAINNNREVAVTKVDYKCPKLKTPEPWVTDRLYDSIIEKLEPRYKLRSRLRAEEFVVFLCSTVKTVIKKKENYEKDVEDLKYEMARLNLIENLFQFFRFVDKFLPWQFQHKSLPLVQSFITGKVVTFEKGTLYDPIL